MQVRRSRTIRPASYEAETSEVTLTSEDVPRHEDEKLQHYLARVELEAFKRMLAFEVFRGHMESSEAANEIRRFKTFNALA